jgi:hypothetical protein
MMVKAEVGRGAGEHSAWALCGDNPAHNFVCIKTRTLLALASSPNTGVLICMSTELAPAPATQALAVPQHTPHERALVMGDLAGLKPEDRLCYYKAVCESVGLNPLTKPFDYIQLNGKLTLYATRAAADQLRRVHGVTLVALEKRIEDDVLYVRCRLQDKTGRADEATAALSIAGLRADALANAHMKCETKAKRRATLSLCGLGILDETELA